MRLSFTPLQYENPRLINKALAKMPLDQLEREAREECQSPQSQASSSSIDKAGWGYSDCLMRAMLK